MKIYLLILAIAFPSFLLGQSYQDTNNHTTITTPEGTGEYLSYLLINRADIRESPKAIDIKKLFSDEDFSKFEDSPALFIVSVLYGQQLMLPIMWDKLLLQADSLDINQNTKYIKTTFIQTHRDQFEAVAILQSSNKYYTLSFQTIDWGGEWYIMQTSDRIKVYDSLDSLGYDCFRQEKPNGFDDENFLENEITKSLNSEAYTYKSTPHFSENKKIIPSCSILTDGITSSIELKRDFSELEFLLKDSHLKQAESCFYNEPESDVKDSLNTRYDEEINKKWNDLLSSINDKGATDLSLYKTLLSNVLSECSDVYLTVATYEFKADTKKYTFDCYLILINGEWKLLNLSPIEEEELFRLFE